MKLYTKIRLAMDMIAQNQVNFYLSCLLMGVGILLVGFTYTVVIVGDYCRQSADTVLSVGIQNTGMMNVSKIYTEDDYKLRTVAYDSPLIESIGSMNISEWSPSYAPELYEVQKGHTIHSNVMNENNNIKYYEIDKELLSISNLSVKQGIDADKLDFSKSVKYIYLGYAFRDIPIGTQYTVDYGDEKEIYEVAGILENDTRLISLEQLYSVSYNTVRCDMNMDYQILSINDGPSYTSPWIFSVSKEYSMEEGMAELEKIANEFNVSVEVFPLQEKFGKASKETEIMKNCLLEMLILLVISILVIVITLQIVQIYHSARQYGLLYAVGFSFLDIQQIMFIRNVVYSVCSVFIGCGLLLWIGDKYFIVNNQVGDMFYELLSTRIMPLCILFIIGICVCVTVIPCYIFQKMSPVELLQGE